MVEKPFAVEAALETVDAEKRSTLRRMAKMAFVAPVVASFAMDGLTIGTAAAQSDSESITSNHTHVVG